MHESMLDYAKRRYLKIAVALCVSSIIAYAWHDPLSPPNGGTWLGYTLGGIGAALILWLTALGVRKRSYSSSLGTLRGWTSAHVYLGLALIVVATLHTGFQFGWNLHTLCYALMLIVIGSGIFGMVAYLRYPQLMSTNRAGSKPDVLLEEINDLDQRALRVANEMPRRFGDVLRSNREGTRVGGSTRAILGGLDLSTIHLPAAGGASQHWRGTCRAGCQWALRQTAHSVACPCCPGRIGLTTATCGVAGHSPTAEEHCPARSTRASRMSGTAFERAHDCQR